MMDDHQREILPNFINLKNLVSCFKGSSCSIVTKWTTILLYLVQDNFIGLVDSRENYEADDVKYVYSDLRKKYRVFGNSVLVIFMDDVLIGQVVLRHLDQVFLADNKPTSDEVAQQTYKFYPSYIH